MRHKTDDNRLNDFTSALGVLTAFNKQLEATAMPHGSDVRVLS
jgi:hypothetical protein